MQRDDILQQENRHVSTYILTRSHTAMMKSTETVQQEWDALPFLPLVLHPTLSSFPSWVHAASEKGIHSWKLWWRRRRRSKRVRKWRKEGGREEERTHGARRETERESERGEGGGGAAHPGRWKSRCVRFRASLLLLIHTAQGGRFGNYLKRKSRICYRWVALYNLLLSSALVPPFRCLCCPREPQHENTTHAMA